MQRKWFSVLLVVAAILAIAVQPAAAIPSTTVVISEFRTHGPGVIGDQSDAPDDQFIELYNLSASPVDIHGYSINAWDPTDNIWYVAQIADATDPNKAITLQPYQHFLLVNGTAYSNVTTPDWSFDVGIPGDVVGIALIAADGTTIVDAVSTTADPANPYKEGTSLAAMSGVDYSGNSYARKPDSLSVNGGHKNGIDSDNNATDFNALATASPESQASSPLAVTLRDLTAQAQSPATWLWPAALLLVLSGAVIVARRRA